MSALYLDGSWRMNILSLDILINIRVVFVALRHITKIDVVFIFEVLKGFHGFGVISLLI